MAYDDDDDHYDDDDDDNDDEEDQYGMFDIFIPQHVEGYIFIGFVCLCHILLAHLMHEVKVSLCHTPGIRKSCQMIRYITCRLKGNTIIRNGTKRNKTKQNETKRPSVGVCVPHSFFVTIFSETFIRRLLKFCMQPPVGVQ